MSETFKRYANEQKPNAIDPLYEGFITHYNEYEKFVELEKSLTLPTLSLMLFGVSGAGKSTFLARLLSEKSEKSFYEDVIKRDKEFITEGDVKIGRSVSSVTVVPRVYPVKDVVSIYDVPGFKDTDDSKKIIINILHKCLLAHVTKNKFIAVIKLDVIEDERMTHLIGDYYDSFAQLFGSQNYRKCIENVYFVITHFDKRNITVKEIIMMIKEKMISAIDLPDKDQLAYFLKRLMNKHIIVDYRDISQDQLINKLSDLFEDEKGKEAISQKDLLIPHFDVYENELNKRLQRDLQAYINELTTVTTKFWEKMDSLRKIILDTKANITGLEQQVAAAERELKLIGDFLETVDKNIEIFQRSIDNLKYEKETLLADTSSQETIQTVIDRSLQGGNLINCRVDVSRAGTFGSTHSLDCLINIDPTQHKDQVILITRYEQNDDTMKAFFGNNSIIPLDYDKVRQFNGQVILYNSANNINRNILVESNFSDASKQLRIKAQCQDGQFKMFLYYCTDISKSLVPTFLKGSFATKIQANKKKVIDLDEKVNSHHKDIEKLRDNDMQKRNRQTELRTQLTELNIQISAFTTTLTSTTTAFNTDLGGQQKYLNGIKQYELYTIGNRIHKIFSQNKLKSSISEQISVINKLIDEETQKINTYRKNFATLSKTDGTTNS